MLLYNSSQVPQNCLPSPKKSYRMGRNSPEWKGIFRSECSSITCPKFHRTASLHQKKLQNGQKQSSMEGYFQERMLLYNSSQVPQNCLPSPKKVIEWVETVKHGRVFFVLYHLECKEFKTLIKCIILDVSSLTGKNQVNFNCVKTHLICVETIFVVENVVQKFVSKIIIFF